MKHLTKPTLSAPTVDAVMQYNLDVLAYNKAACKQVDDSQFYGAPAPASAKRDKKTGAQITAERALTPADKMANDPMKLQAYKDLLKSLGAW